MLLRLLLGSRLIADAAGAAAVAAAAAAAAVLVVVVVVVAVGVGAASAAACVGDVVLPHASNASNASKLRK